MNSAACVGRVGGLAVALGVGVAVVTGSGCGLAWGDTPDAASAESSTSTQSSTGAENAEKATTPGATEREPDEVSKPDADPASTSTGSTTSKAPPGVVVSTGGAHTSTTTSDAEKETEQAEEETEQADEETEPTEPTPSVTPPDPGEPEAQPETVTQPEAATQPAPGKPAHLAADPTDTPEPTSTVDAVQVTVDAPDDTAVPSARKTPRSRITRSIPLQHRPSRRRQPCDKPR